MSEDDFKVVYIHDENVYGEIISHGSFASLISYKINGIEYQGMFLNEEFEFVYDIGIQEIEEESE